MKKFISVSVLLILLTGCSMESSVDYQQMVATERNMQELNRQIGMPAITNYQEKKLMKQIYELRDREDFTTYAYLKNEYSGELVFLGECIGYGLPYSVQYSNPEVYKYSGVTLPQAEPNGLFMPEGLSATWLLLIDPDTGEPRPVYVEPEIVVSPFKLH